MRKLLFIFLFVICGCATTSTGIVPMGPDTYMVSRQGGSGATGTGMLKAESILEANGFCTENKKLFLVTHTQETPAGLGRFPQAEIQFMCLNPGDPQLVRPRMTSDPNRVIEIHNQ